MDVRPANVVRTMAAHIRNVLAACGACTIGGPWAVGASARIDTVSLSAIYSF